MIREGQIVLFKFPLADKSVAKLRPALVLKKLPGHHNDWLICMISSQLSQRVADFDEVIDPEATERRKRSRPCQLGRSVARVLMCSSNMR